jgi:hypothetical protein
LVSAKPDRLFQLGQPRYSLEDVTFPERDSSLIHDGNHGWIRGIQHPSGEHFVTGSAETTLESDQIAIQSLQVGEEWAVGNKQTPGQLIGEPFPVGRFHVVHGSSPGSNDFRHEEFPHLMGNSPVEAFYALLGSHDNESLSARPVSQCDATCPLGMRSVEHNFEPEQSRKPERIHRRKSQAGGFQLLLAKLIEKLSGKRRELPKHAIFPFLETGRRWVVIVFKCTLIPAGTMFVNTRPICPIPAFVKTY